MANWHRKLRLKDVWNSVDDGEKTIQELAGIVAARLKALAPFKDEGIEEAKAEIVDSFEDLAEDEAANYPDFYYIMEDLYNWGDTRLDDEWPGKKVCWVETL